MSHPSPLAAVQQRALALRAAGDHDAARTLLADAVGSARPPYGEDHPETLHTAHLLARLHREADDPLAARRVLEEAFAAGERRWDHSEPTMLALAFELAEVAEELGNRHEARRNYTRVASAGPAALGENHPVVRAARNYLGAGSPAAEQPYVGPPTSATSSDSGARSALSGPTLSLATLAAMRPTTDGPPPPASPWAPQPSPTPAGPTRPASAVPRCRPHGRCRPASGSSSRRSHPGQRPAHHLGWPPSPRHTRGSSLHPRRRASARTTRRSARPPAGRRHRPRPDRPPPRSGPPRRPPPGRTPAPASAAVG
ncbi:tetratricopeptide repeat protein [Micromonospora sp. CA-246542]|uniref:tetratricopeptide repeat protein n=1 Tax=Micromonospora sp. CA-246542 TaxID=3239959 RepID=UPI003D928149